ncbi:tigger transposable element-derived protein 4 [Aplysia californica]|uniref:Tigger transposable element-derived protein 4 n=1 Tax=Aplysia californica TaxID=6500 RepID=A0ABM0JS26_APLCA|nr:tigger transposable element-derived protein 4 [Aplysia californica]
MGSLPCHKYVVGLHTAALSRPKARHAVSMKVVCGESASVSTETSDNWRKGQLQEILGKYQPSDIFSADEIGLFYKCLPTRTLARQGEVCSENKIPKERLTLLLAANTDGTETLPLLTIGRFEKPRCFKHTKTLPTEYKFNRKTRMTGTIFEQWVQKLDRKFILQGRSVALIVDNCSAHPHLTDLKAIQLFFSAAEHNKRTITVRPGNYTIFQSTQQKESAKTTHSYHGQGRER